jgi:ribosomal protein S18 acetylase RimI-like enzyme
MNIVPYIAERLDSVAQFIARLNSEQAHHIGYFGIKPVDIAQAIQSFDPPPEEGVRLAYDGEQLIGAVGVEADVELGRAWLYGPFVDHPHWDVIADQLYVTVQEAIPAGVYEHELFCDTRNSNCVSFATRHHFPSHGESAILTFSRDRLTVVPHTTAPELEAASFEAFQILHSRLFPRTYFSAQQIIDKRNEYAKVFVATSGELFQGYIFVKVDFAIGEGYIDYIGVTEECRQQGIGKSLLAAALHWMFSFPEIQQTSLTVAATNQAALKLYAALGFEQEHMMRVFRKNIRV